MSREGETRPASIGSGLSAAEMRRYGRHLVLPEVGLEGQERLKAARVLLVGLGGLGAPAGLYLAAAGVGTLGLVDFDVVEESNLQRQVLFATEDVGRPKIEASAARLAGVNPHVVLETHGVRLGRDNVAELVAAYDVVVDGSDNFATRYLVNDACVAAGKADVWGAISRFEGQVSVFWAGRGPCYRCLFPEPPPPGLVPSCAEAGVLGVLPGIIGSIQANEALKLLLGIGEPLVGRFVVFDALALAFREVRISRSSECPACGAAASGDLPVYETTCAAPVGEPEGDITPVRLAETLAGGESPLLLDVRSPEEHAIGRLAGSILIPVDELAGRLEELDRDADIVTYCHVGARSAWAADLLRRSGFTRVRNLAGGIDAWSREVDPSVPRY